MSKKLAMKLDYFATRYRLIGSKMVITAVVLLLMVSQSKWDPEGFTDTLFEMLGLFFVIACTLGRIWVSMYIAGYKNRELITVGPYSIMRNPLYFFNLLGAIGLGFSSESLLVLAILLLTFAINYPLVVLHEERKLMAHYDNKYVDYMNRTPRFFPKLSIYHEPEKYLVDSRRYRQAFLDGFLFLYANGAFTLIERLHEAHVLPTFFRII